MVIQMQAILDSLDAEARELLEQEQRAAAEAEARARQEEYERQLREEAERNKNNNNNSGSGSTGGGYTPGTDIPPNGSVVDYAVSRLGCPYVWGATGPNSFDCSGLTSWCYNQTGVWITRTTETQKAAARAVLPVGEAQPGDVLYTYGHVGICTQPGGGEYIHAPQPGDVVKYANWAQFWCALRF
jgi:cell wall-associated NlpC family hydrolase